MNLSLPHCQKVPHDGLEADCSCGYYCFHQNHMGMARINAMTNRRNPGVKIGGIVKLWGKTEVHSTGMRSEFAVPDVLFLPEKASDALLAVIEKLASDYGAEVGAARPMNTSGA